MNHLQVYNFVNQRLKKHKASASSKEPTIDPVSCTSFKELVSCCKEFLHWTPEAEKTLAVMLAVVLSTTMEGGQLGLRVIGPPGSLKSTLAEAIGHARTPSIETDYVYPRSTFRGIISGWHKVGKENQLARKLNGLCLLIKEADALLQTPNLQQIESELRDVLGDGVIRPEYRTGKEDCIYTAFSVILCGTKALRRMDDAILGSRFVDTVIHEPTTSHKKIIDRAVSSQFEMIRNSLNNPNGKTKTGEQKERIKYNVRQIAPPMVGFIQHKKEQLSRSLVLSPLSDNQQSSIKAMGELVSHCRAKVERDKKGDILYRPEKELPTRISEQLLRLAVFLSFVLSEETSVAVSDQTMGILSKVFRDTCEGFKYEVLSLLSQEGALDSNRIAFLLKVSDSHTYNLLRDMREVGTVGYQKVSNIHGSGGKSHYYTLTNEVRSLAEEVL